MKRTNPKTATILIAALAATLSGCATVTPESADGCGPQDHLPAEERLSNKPKWATASEEDNFGFDVYRSETEDGEFVKLTETPILGAGTTDEPSYYQYVDDSIDPCKSYWYYVESISMSGEREKFTPTYQAKPKRTPGADQPE